MKRYIPLLCVMVLLISCAENDKPDSDLSSGPDTVNYQNPVFGYDFPDPAIIKAANGWYYVYATQSNVNGSMQNIQTLKSYDLIRWERVGDALPEKPSWAQSTQDFWAPHVIYDEGQEKYFMYYSGKSDNTDYDKCLGVAVSDTPEGPFIDKGEPLICGEGFINIDPMAFDDPTSGKHLLYWGSGFSPIKVQELDDSRLDFKINSAPVDLVFPNVDEAYSHLVEGAWVTFKEGKYYLFYSGDNCCGENANYAVMVARADDPFGPFQKYETAGRENSVILEKNNYWLAPGHNSVIADGEGSYWMLYHAIRNGDPNARIMLIDQVLWNDGWPVVQGPSREKIKKPVTTR